MENLKKAKIQAHTITVVPRYCETDQGGVVHHSVYPIWFEMGRTELLRANGLAYKDLEKAGTFFVMVELRIRYHRPALYDEQLKLTTTCSGVTASRVEHTYKLTDVSKGRLLVEGSSVLACVNRQGKIRRMPKFMSPE